MNGPFDRFGPLAARACLSLIFLLSGLNKIGNFSGTQGYMEQHGMPAAALMLVGAIVLELAGGLSVLLGLKARWGALALIIFLIPASLIFHAFWKVPQEQQQVQMIMFLKNVSILGGLLMIAARGPGAMSFDERSSAT